MDSSAKIIKATGIVHMIHGGLLALILLCLFIFLLPGMSIMGGLLMFAIIVGVCYLYFYIGYELYALREPQKTRNILIAAIILACFDVLSAIVKGVPAGIVFVAELILSIISICNIESYRKFKKKRK